MELRSAYGERSVEGRNRQCLSAMRAFVSGCLRRPVLQHSLTHAVEIAASAQKKAREFRGPVLLHFGYRRPRCHVADGKIPATASDQ